MQTIPSTIPCNTVQWQLENGSLFTFSVARLDELHPVVSGNKWFKLKYNLQQALLQNKQGILTMGGAYSNHLAATAFACNSQQLQSAGIIRGELVEPLNSTLSFCKAQGMELLAVARQNYQLNSKRILQLQQRYHHFLFVPEGGNNTEGMLGCKEILSAITAADEFTHIVCAMGTGTTFKGIAASAKKHQTVIGMPAVKIKPEEQTHFLKEHANVDTAAKTTVLFEHAGKGYGKTERSLLHFMNSFYTKTGIPTDIVYTGKLMQAMLQLAGQDYFPGGSRVLAIHSGGLQGNNSLPQGSLLF